MTLQVGVLGPVEVRDNGASLGVRGTRPLAIVALLALHHGETVSAERLLDEVWGEDLPQGGTSAVQVQVSKLRRQLGPDAITTAGGGYAMPFEGTVVDSRSFESLSRAGRAAFDGGDGETAVSRFEEALALWRGEPLSGVGNPPFAPAARARLGELRQSCLEDRFDAQLSLGAHHSLVADLELQTRTNPLRERLWGQLMVALYRSGRQADALRAFQVARATLAEQLGVDPGAELMRLEQAMLVHDPSLELRRPELVRGLSGVVPVVSPPLSPGAGETAPAPGEPTPAPSLVRRRTNLTGPATPFIGRAAERAAIDALMGRSRIVTLVGPGGAGKTRLAIESARARLDGYRDGVWMVELAGLRDPDQIPALLASCLGLREIDPGAPRADRAGIERVGEYLSAKELLLILDNCEHVIVAAARLVDELARVAPGLSVLATSREGLGIDGESLWPVPPLRLEESVALFVERARAASPSFDASAAAVEIISQICHRLDGLPLAIELAAARARALPLPEILRRLDDRFRLLTGGSRAALPRQQTLRAVVDWSYDLLDDDERAVFNRLSVFTESCSLEAAEYVCGPGGGAGEAVCASAADVADIVARLVDKSLLHPVHSGMDVRYQLLQTLSQYGREQLAARSPQEAAAVRNRHVRYYCELALRAEPELRSYAQGDWMGLLTAELANFRAALDWALSEGDHLAVLTIAPKLSWFWWLAGRPTEGCDWIDRGLVLAGDDVEPLVRGEALIWSGFLSAFAGDYTRGLANLEAGTAVARTVGRADLVGVGTAAAGNLYCFAGEFDLADALLAEAEAAFHSLDDEWGASVVEMLYCTSDLGRSEFVRAQSRLVTLIERFRAADFGWALTSSLSQLMEVEFYLGNYEAARVYADEASELTARFGYRAYHASCLAFRAQLDRVWGDLDGATARAAQAMAMAEDVALPWARCVVAFVAGEVARSRGDFVAFDAHLAMAAAMADASDIPNMSCAIANQFAYLAEHRGDGPAALSHALEALELSAARRSMRSVALALETMVNALSLLGEAALAGRTLAAARAVRRYYGCPSSPPELADVDRALARLAARGVDISPDLGAGGFAWPDVPDGAELTELAAAARALLTSS